MSSVMSLKKNKFNCKFCFTDLWHQHTFIKCESTACAELGTSLCLECFAAGTVDHVHKNTDPYKVLCNAIKISNYMWPANDEIMLLDTFMDTMSWERVAKKLGRSPKECELHYFENFVLRPKLKGLDYANKNAFRFNKCKWPIENKTNILENTLDLEGTYFLLHKIPQCFKFNECIENLI